MSSGQSDIYKTNSIKHMSSDKLRFNECPKKGVGVPRGVLRVCFSHTDSMGTGNTKTSPRATSGASAHLFCSVLLLTFSFQLSKLRIEGSWLFMLSAWSWHNLDMVNPMLTYRCLWKNTPLEKNNLGKTSSQSTKSGPGEQFLPQDCRAKAHLKGVFSFRHRHCLNMSWRLRRATSGGAGLAMRLG